MGDLGHGIMESHVNIMESIMEIMSASWNVSLGHGIMERKARHRKHHGKSGHIRESIMDGKSWHREGYRKNKKELELV
ncbi:hypothetical protein QYF36_005419 [Acer negundo]|nr:hypothetical protein QYF36_005419 [Acer negundo]